MEDCVISTEIEAPELDPLPYMYAVMILLRANSDCALIAERIAGVVEAAGLEPDMEYCKTIEEALPDVDIQACLDLTYEEETRFDFLEPDEPKEEEPEPEEEEEEEYDVWKHLFG